MASQNYLLPTVAQCQSLTDDQCRRIQDILDPQGIRANKDWELQHQYELIRLYMTMKSFPQIENAMRKKMDCSYVALSANTGLETDMQLDTKHTTIASVAGSSQLPRPSGNRRSSSFMRAYQTNKIQHRSRFLPHKIESCSPLDRVHHNKLRSFLDSCSHVLSNILSANRLSTAFLSPQSAHLRQAVAARLIHIPMTASQTLASPSPQPTPLSALVVNTQLLLDLGLNPKLNPSHRPGHHNLLSTTQCWDCGTICYELYPVDGIIAA